MHIDLFGPTRTTSVNGIHYKLVVIDDFTIWNWVKFLTHKDDAFEEFYRLCKKIENEKGCKIVSVKSDHGGKFEIKQFQNFCENYGINPNFSTLRTPQQNGVIERKNRSLQEMARTMLNNFNTSKHLWAEAVNTTCYL